MSPRAKSIRLFAGFLALFQRTVSMTNLDIVGFTCKLGPLGFLRAVCVALVFCNAAAVSSPAITTFTRLVSFDGANGANPVYAPLVQGFNGNFYGTTYSGGANGEGTVFEITPAGTLTVLHSFGSQTNDGTRPYAGLVQATNGNLYGTTYSGGANGYGTVFQITPDGALTTLYSFCALANCADGADPAAGLIQANNGNFFGTTFGGGTNGDGTVFEITTTGKFTTLHSFDLSDGAFPNAPLVQAANGNFYGTTSAYGANFYGTVFQITAGGQLSTLANFDWTNGAYAYDGLVQATNGNFYGTTTEGGTGNNGTVFEITSSGTLTALYSFCSLSNCADGEIPFGALIQATNGDLYGTATEAGAAGEGHFGTTFQITPTGALSTLYNFCSLSGCTDGEQPEAALLQATNGTFYGVTAEGGASGDGTVFSLSLGLGPFLKTLPSSGKVGSRVTILGNGLLNATRVTFNGTAATITVDKNSEIRTTVPAGATSGTVEVTTANGKTLKSNVAFRVTP